MRKEMSNMKKIILLMLVTLSFGITKTSASNKVIGHPGTVCITRSLEQETKCFDENDTERIEQYKHPYKNQTVDKMLMSCIVVLVGAIIYKHIKLKNRKK